MVELPIYKIPNVQRNKLQLKITNLLVRPAWWLMLSIHSIWLRWEESFWALGQSFTSKHLHIAPEAKAMVPVSFNFFIHRKLLWHSCNLLFYSKSALPFTHALLQMSSQLTHISSQSTLYSVLHSQPPWPIWSYRQNPHCWFLVGWFTSTFWWLQPFDFSPKANTFIWCFPTISSSLPPQNMPQKQTSSHNSLGKKKAAQF